MGLFDKLVGAAGGAPGSETHAGTVARGAPRAEGRSRGFDCVKVAAADGRVKLLSPREFEALPLEERIHVLVRGTARFFRGDEEIASGEALKSAY
jgi:hypothetical protein